MNAVNVDLSDVGIVVLNYMTSNETKEMVASVKNYYPKIRIIVVDNGSTEVVVNDLRKMVDSYSNVSLLALGSNLGFAKGNNAGIYKLREEGFSFVCCSNNDIILEKPNVLEILKYYSNQEGAALIGPRIITLDDQEQNPVRLHRPTPEQAKRILKKNYWANQLKRVARDLILEDGRQVLRNLRQFIIKENNFSRLSLQHAMCNNCHVVYSLHGSFIMMTNSFFEYYNGFDENTFLYFEEEILAEMLWKKDLKAIFVPEVYVLHKEDRTSNYIWGGQSQKAEI